MYLRRDWPEAVFYRSVVRKLEEHGAMDHTIIVAAGAADSAAMQFLAPSLVVQWANTSATKAKTL